MKQKKDTKVLIILNDLKNGGVERVLSVLANYLSERGYDVYILAIASAEVSYPLSSDIKYKYVPLRKIYGKNTIWDEIKGLKVLYREMKKINPDNYIGFEDSIIVRSVPLAWLMKKNIVVSERTDPSVYRLPMQIVRQITYDMAHYVVFQTKDAQEYFPKRTQNKSLIIPNPLSERLPYWDGKGNRDIIMACRLRTVKNIPLAIRAFKKFVEKHNDYRLVVYGEGEQLQELYRYAEEIGIDSKVAFPGHVNNIHEIMANASMYLSTSNYEGISNSMIEALAIGVPCICTDCPVGGAKMFIEHKVNGMLVNVNDADSVAEAMTYIAEHPEKMEEMSYQSRKIRNILSREEIGSKWERLLVH